MSLKGSISPYIGNLSFLKYFVLFDNHFSGGIPEEIGHLSRLEVLFLANNSLTGKIPRNLSSCKSLKLLALIQNNLVGGIPAELGSLSMLQQLHLMKNYFSGTIPVSLSNLSFLTRFDLSWNNLQGNIPSELGQLSRLSKFSISVNNISGTIPHQIFNISSITVFSVSVNKLHGSIPPYIGTSFPRLETFYIGKNRFSGVLPYTISNLSKLSILDVSQNQFTGPVPKLGSLHGLIIVTFDGNHLGGGEVDDLGFFNSLSNCSHLELFSIVYNNLSGQLPASIANLSTKLTKLYMGQNNIFGEIPPGIENLVSLNGLGMESNQLTGSVPVSIGKLPKLILVNIEDNQFSGKIPSNICNSTQLEVVGFSFNRLHGDIPSNFGNCSKLRLLYLYENQLTGTIPKQLFGLSSLSDSLDLSSNHLTGDLPSEIGNLVKIVRLDLSNNQLSGNIPSSFKNCLGLQELHLDGNLFEGVIPPSLRSLKGIEYLGLSRNNLTGQIPKYFETFVSLVYLNLSSNHLEGEVPKLGVFKNISAFSVDGNDKLCGGIPILRLPSCPSHASKKKSKQFHLKRLLLIIFGVVVCVILLGSFLIWFWRRKATISSSSLKTLVEDKFRKVSYSELLKATNGFSSENLVGVGSYGSVYKGLLTLSQETTTFVAVKVLDLQRRGASKSFMAECEAMRSIRHRNLVKMLTSCSSIDFKGNDFKALISEFMPNGSLESWLHPVGDGEQLQRSARRSLSFIERLNVAADVASALDYLHHHCQTPIVHCDLKPSNVLLDDDMNGHVGDFGLAKFLGDVIINVETEHHTTSTSVGIRGSIGYAAPEYGMGSDVSTSGDIYSYGIMVLEMITGRRPTDIMFTDGLNLHAFAKTALLTDRVMEIIDPALLVPVRPEDGDGNTSEIQANTENNAKLRDAATGIVNLGILCSTETPRERMDMAHVVKELQSIKKIHLSGVGSE
ncbi:probable LRR receptor-like serine/threonine-protein kinase At3g47570 isoform X2 [Papaver somniferum]|nr:probable LRR receptor-like serine/threonine-protein kinase At3g47570 isoform X2 [Papaver somniferum]XP_026404568.1 probable LRR receptor-like serine/threonine-protein kinase At3g47570 isoform X2 [Papaver somniferum]